MSSESNESILSKLQNARLPLWITLVLAALLVFVFVSQRMVLSAAEARLAAETQRLTEQFAAEKSALLARANSAISGNSEAAHLLVGKTLSWAVRGEQIRGNLGEIDQFVGELVRNERVQQVLVVDRDGRISLASDRKLQGAAFSDHFPADLLGAPDVSVTDGGDGLKHLVMPIQGLNARLGSVLVVYRPEPLLSE